MYMFDMSRSRCLAGCLVAMSCLAGMACDETSDEPPPTSSDTSNGGDTKAVGDIRGGDAEADETDAHSKRRDVVSDALDSERRDAEMEGDAPESPDGGVQIASSGIGYTHLRSSGNRYVKGSGDLTAVEPVDVELPGTPRWVVGLDGANRTLWTVALEDGRVRTFELDGGSARPVGVSSARLPEGMPPSVRVRNGELELMRPPTSEASEQTHPVPIVRGRGLAFVERGGDLVLRTAGIGGNHLSIDALPDARLVHDRAGRLLALGGATTRYTHGVLGDETEATTIAVVDTTPVPELVRTISMPEGRVIEGIAPIWSDVDGDEDREIVVTTSGPDQGARIVVFDETGERLAAGPAIGQGFRWRHQLAVAPFGPSGEREIADVLTPHIGGTVEFYRKRGDDLEIVASVDGYSSHSIGSRNLDMAAAGDFDADDRVELLVPRESKRRLGAVQRTDSGARTDWSLAFDTELTTNLAAVPRSDGTLALAVGTAGKTLRIWQP